VPVRQRLIDRIKKQEEGKALGGQGGDKKLSPEHLKRILKDLKLNHFTQREEGYNGGGP
jgi:hypothetical protein